MTTHCQICARQIKSPNGRIAHHGYRRPAGWVGSQTRSCFGALCLPYEDSNNVIQPYIDILLRHRGELLSRIEPVKSGTVSVPDMRRSKAISPDSPLYELRRREHESRLTYELKCLDQHIQEMEARRDNWSPDTW